MHVLHWLILLVLVICGFCAFDNDRTNAISAIQSEDDALTKAAVNTAKSPQDFRSKLLSLRRQIGALGASKIKKEVKAAVLRKLDALTAHLAEGLTFEETTEALYCFLQSKEIISLKQFKHLLDSLPDFSQKRLVRKWMSKEFPINRIGQLLAPLTDFIYNVDLFPTDPSLDKANAVMYQDAEITNFSHPLFIFYMILFAPISQWIYFSFLQVVFNICMKFATRFLHLIFIRRLLPSQREYLSLILASAPKDDVEDALLDSDERLEEITLFTNLPPSSTTSLRKSSFNDKGSNAEQRKLQSMTADIVASIDELATIGLDDPEDPYAMEEDLRLIPSTLPKFVFLALPNYYSLLDIMLELFGFFSSLKIALLLLLLINLRSFFQFSRKLRKMADAPSPSWMMQWIESIFAEPYSRLFPYLILVKFVLWIFRLRRLSFFFEYASPYHPSANRRHIWELRTILKEPSKTDASSNVQTDPVTGRKILSREQVAASSHIKAPKKIFYQTPNRKPPLSRSVIRLVFSSCSHAFPILFLLPICFF